MTSYEWQQEFVESKAALTVVRAVRGSGKTMGILKWLEKQRGTTIVVSPNAMQSDRIRSIFVEQNLRDVIGSSNMSVDMMNGDRFVFLGAFNAGHCRGLRYDNFVIDEAGFVGSSLMREMLGHTPSGGRCLLVGSFFQAGSFIEEIIHPSALDGDLVKLVTYDRFRATEEGHRISRTLIESMDSCQLEKEYGPWTGLWSPPRVANNENYAYLLRTLK